MRHDLKTRDIANQLGVSPKTVTRWAREGRIPAFRIGPKSLRYAMTDVMDALRRGQAGCDGSPFA
jgi:excisionase family DNA binding protein